MIIDILITDGRVPELCLVGIILQKHMSERSHRKHQEKRFELAKKYRKDFLERLVNEYE